MGRESRTLRGLFVQLGTIVVNDHDRAIVIFVDVMGFELIEDSPSITNNRAKRWVVVRPLERPRGPARAGRRPGSRRVSADARREVGQPQPGR
jgi:hypothetical protein